MNFFAHYWLDRQQEDPEYTLGLILPDLLRIPHRAYRLPIGFQLQKNSSASSQRLFEACQRHFEIDGLWHNAPVFEQYKKKLIDVLLRFDFEAVNRPRFLAHLLLELDLDRLLIAKHPDELDRCYDLMETAKRSAVKDLLQQLEWPEQIQNDFLQFLQQFLQDRWLHRYVEDEAFLSLLSRVYRRGSKEQAKLKTEAGKRMLHQSDKLVTPLAQDFSIGRLKGL